MSKLRLKRNKCLSQRLKSFVYAFRGVAVLISTQPNAKIHLLAGMTACSLGFYFHITRIEWALIILCIGIVFAAEAFNSAIEFLADEVTLEHRERIRFAKDLGAAAVLWTCIAAAIIGGIIFFPYIRFVCFDIVR